MTSVSIPRRLQWLILAGFTAALAITVASFLERRAGNSVPRSLPPEIASGVGQQTQAFSLSKTLGGQTLYTVEAERVTHFKETGKALLQGVSITVYGKQGDRQDRISTQECEYDPATGSLLIPGEVLMELGIPLSDSPEPPGERVAVSISITTSRLSFDQNTGTSRTQSEVRFRFAQGEGTSRGASFDPQQQLLVLDADVQFTLRDTGHLEPTPANVRAAQLRFWSEQGRAVLSGPVEVTKGSRSLQAGASVITLDEQRRVREVWFSDGVRGTERTPVQTADVRSERGRLQFGESGTVQALELERHVRWTSASAQANQQGEAERVHLSFHESFRGPGTVLGQILAYDRVRMILAKAASASSPAPRAEAAQPVPEKGTQIISSRQVEVGMAGDGKTLRSVRTQGGSRLELVEEKRTVVGDDFEFAFGAEGDLEKFLAEGNVRATAEGPGEGARTRITTSEFLAAGFDPSTHGLESLEQWGEFHYRDGEWQASAERAEDSVREDRVVLEGNPRVWSPAGKVGARKITFSKASGNWSAEERVLTTYFPAPRPSQPKPEPLHGTADRAQYDAAAGKAQLEGHARLWQGTALLVEANRLEFDRGTGELVARNRVYSVFQGLLATGLLATGLLAPGLLAPQSEKGSVTASKPAGPSRASSPVEIRSEYLVYRPEQRKARYQQGVKMQSQSLELKAEELEIFFEAGETEGAAGSQVERAVAQGGVVIVEGGRTATGDRAEYAPASEEVRLFGEMATISDEQGNRTQGLRLTYFIGDDRIQVDGKPGSPTEAWWRVHP